MLTIGQQQIIEQFAKDLISLIRNAVVNKPIKRVSIRRVKGKYVKTNFSSPVNASGDLAKTLRYELTDKKLAFYANDYIYELIFGKKPTLSAAENDLNLESKIKEWMADKGIKAVDGKSDDTIAHLITEKIRRFGSSIYLATGTNNSGLLSNIISDKLISDYNAKFVEVLGQEFRAAFING